LFNDVVRSFISNDFFHELGRTIEVCVFAGFHETVVTSNCLEKSCAVNTGFLSDGRNAVSFNNDRIAFAVLGEPLVHVTFADAGNGKFGQESIVRGLIHQDEELAALFNFFILNIVVRVELADDALTGFVDHNAAVVLKGCLVRPNGGLSNSGSDFHAVRVDLAQIHHLSLGADLHRHLVAFAVGTLYTIVERVLKAAGKHRLIGTETTCRQDNHRSLNGVVDAVFAFCFDTDHAAIVNDEFFRRSS